MQRERLQDQFTKALDNFQNIQREAADKERQKLKAAQYDQDQVTLPGPGEGFGAQQSRTQMMLEEEDRLKELEDREKAMRQLESDIGDVNEIFKDLATLVHDQGEIIDSIESNIESTAVHVETGAEQLRQVTSTNDRGHYRCDDTLLQAAVYQNKARKKKIILALVGVIILGTLINL